MSFETYDPDFQTAEKVRDRLICEGYFDKTLSTRSVVLSLEVLADRHNIGKGKAGYEVTTKHLPAVTQYIDRDEVVRCAVDVS